MDERCASHALPRCVFALSCTFYCSPVHFLRFAMSEVVSDTAPATALRNSDLECVQASMKRRMEELLTPADLSWMGYDHIVRKIRRHFEAAKDEVHRFKWISKIPMVEVFNDLEPQTILDKFSAPGERLYSLLVASSAYYDHFTTDELFKLARAIDAIGLLLPRPSRKKLNYFVGGSYPAYLRGYTGSYRDIDIFVMLPKGISNSRKRVEDRLSWYSYYPYDSPKFAKTDEEKAARQCAALLHEIDSKPNGDDGDLMPYSLFAVFNSAENSPFQLIIVNEESMDPRHKGQVITMKTPVDVVEQFDLQIVQAGISNIDGEFHVQGANRYDPATDTDPRRTERRQRHGERICGSQGGDDEGIATLASNTLWNQLR